MTCIQYTEFYYLPESILCYLLLSSFILHKHRLIFKFEKGILQFILRLIYDS
jgi:hypothetical protein